MLLCLVFYLPLPLGSNRPWAWALNEVLISMIFLLSLVSFTGKAWFSALNKGRWLLLPLACFCAYTWLQWFAFYYPQTSWLQAVASADPSQTWVQLLKSISYWLLCALVFLMVQRRQQLLWLLAIMILAGVVQGFYGAFLVLAKIDPTPVFSLPLNPRASGSFVYHNHLANFLMLNLCLGFGLLVAQLKHNTGGDLKHAIGQFVAAFLTNKALLRMALVIMVIALVLTRSRMGNTAFFAVLTLGSVLLLLFYRHKPASLYVLIISIFVIDTVIVSTWFGLEQVKQRLVSTSLSHETRDEVIDMSLIAIEKRPYTGSGAGSFYSEFQQYVTHSIYGFYDHAHNDYIQFVFESGLIGTALLALVVLAALWQSLWCFLKRKTIQIRGIALGCVMAIIGMLIHISVDFPLQAPAISCYFLIILAISFICPTLGKRSKPQSPTHTQQQASVTSTSSESECKAAMPPVMPKAEDKTEAKAEVDNAQIEEGVSFKVTENTESTTQSNNLTSDEAKDELSSPALPEKSKRPRRDISDDDFMLS